MSETGELDIHRDGGLNDPRRIEEIRENDKATYPTPQIISIASEPWRINSNRPGGALKDPWRINEIGKEMRNYGLPA